MIQGIFLGLTPKILFQYLKNCLLEVSLPSATNTSLIKRGSEVINILVLMMLKIYDLLKCTLCSFILFSVGPINKELKLLEKVGVIDYYTLRVW